jgi:hypothetical protein
LPIVRLLIKKELTRRFPVTLVFAVLCFFSVGAAQNSSSPADDSKSIVKVGVGLPRNQSMMVFTPSWQRGQLVRAINQSGKGKKGEASIEGVALQATSLDDASAEAQKQKCRYVVLVTAVGPQDRIEDDNVSHVRPGEVTNGSSLHMPDLQITYELYKAGAPTALAQGIVVAHGTDYQGQPTQDWNDAVRQGMDGVAKRVIGELRKQRISTED